MVSSDICKGGARYFLVLNIYLVLLGFLMHGSTKENYHCDERIDRIASYNGSFVLVIHGGAGTMERQHSTPEQRAAYRQALAQALNAVRLAEPFPSTIMHSDDRVGPRRFKTWR